MEVPSRPGYMYKFALKPQIWRWPTTVP